MVLSCKNHPSVKIDKKLPKLDPEEHNSTQFNWNTMGHFIGPVISTQLNRFQKNFG